LVAHGVRQTCIDVLFIEIAFVEPLILSMPDPILLSLLNDLCAKHGEPTVQEVNEEEYKKSPVCRIKNVQDELKRVEATSSLSL